MEVFGMATLKVTDADCTRIHIAIDNQEERGVQFQVQRVGMQCRQEEENRHRMRMVALCVYTFEG